MTSEQLVCVLAWHCLKAAGHLWTETTVSRVDSTSLLRVVILTLAEFTPQWHLPTSGDILVVTTCHVEGEGGRVLLTDTNSG